MAITNTAPSPTPAPTMNTVASAYLDFAAGTADWAQQYLPDLMEKEAESYGKRTISGFLAQVGAEEAMASDQVVWSEQGRLHLAYNGTSTSAATGGSILLTTDIDGNAVDGTQDHAVRQGDMVLISDAGSTCTAYVTAVSAATGTDLDTITVDTYTASTLINAGIADGAVTVLVFGSEYQKGQDGRETANEPVFTSYGNKPIILKDMYHVSGSDASAIGWVEVSGEEGQNGYLWYLKAEGDTRARFADYLEMAMIESELSTQTAVPAPLSYNVAATAMQGTQGLFAAIKARGNESSGVTGVNAATDLAEFDAILAEFDKNGAIEENMMFVNRATALAIDDMLASMNSYGAGGTSYGVFNNSEDMALNLGFSGFRRGSYDFYKSDWKYLNDQGTRGGMIDTVNDIRGVIIPAGTSNVYDQGLGKNITRPFLHVRYRASQTESRKLKTWVTGSVGATTSSLDAMEVHYLSERCLVTQGANNFMLLS
jgi:hypothetical protein|tara:strand:- start:775 stop:2226 length:1452 start_codon:yes stop_codon:yes gene_type:complete